MIKIRKTNKTLSEAILFFFVSNLFLPLVFAGEPLQVKSYIPQTKAVVLSLSPDTEQRRQVLIRKIQDQIDSADGYLRDLPKRLATLNLKLSIAEAKARRDYARSLTEFSDLRDHVNNDPNIAQAIAIGGQTPDQIVNDIEKKYGKDLAKLKKTPSYEKQYVDFVRATVEDESANLKNYGNSLKAGYVTTLTNYLKQLKMTTVTSSVIKSIESKLKSPTQVSKRKNPLNDLMRNLFPMIQLNENWVPGGTAERSRDINGMNAQTRIYDHSNGQKILRQVWTEHQYPEGNSLAIQNLTYNEDDSKKTDVTTRVTVYKYGSSSHIFFDFVDNLNQNNFMDQGLFDPWGNLLFTQKESGNLNGATAKWENRYFHLQSDGTTLVYVHNMLRPDGSFNNDDSLAQVQRIDNKDGKIINSQDCSQGGCSAFPKESSYDDPYGDLYFLPT